MHLAGAKAAPLQAGDRPGDWLVANAEVRAAGVREPGLPEAPHLHAANAGIDDRPAAALGAGGVFLFTQLPIQQGQPLLLAGGGVADAGQGGQGYGAVALKAHLQGAAVKQGVEALHRDRQAYQKIRGLGGQGQAAGERRRPGGAGQ